MTGARADFDFDAVVVAADGVGLACGYALARRGLSVVVIGKERAIGQGISSRNSQMAHGGLYCPTGSLRARLRVEGRRQLYAFLESHGVGHARCGKRVVATKEAEIGRLEAIETQAIAHGVEDIASLSAAQVHAGEPELKAVMALISPPKAACLTAMDTCWRFPSHWRAPPTCRRTSSPLAADGDEFERKPNGVGMEIESLGFRVGGADLNLGRVCVRRDGALVCLVGR